MKKLFVALSVGALLVSSVPAQAEQPGAIAIVDANFIPSLVSGDTLSVCVASTASCAVDTKPKTSAQFQAYNHGTIMADVVRSNNPQAKIIMIRAAESTVGTVNGIGFENALDWIQANKAAYNIKSVSFSYNAGDGKKCLPSSPGVNVNSMHSEIVNDVKSLLSVGTTVFAASGNNGASKNYLDYPACIPEVVSVGASLYPTTRALSDVSVSGMTYGSNVLSSSLKTLQDSNILGIGLPNKLRVGLTTSVATAIIASKN
jgi:hypothetical protein